MKLLRILAACTVLAIPSPLEAQPLRFVRESLQFTLAPDSFSFFGIYYFDNPGSKLVESTIFYPFVLSDSIPDSVTVVEAHTGKNIHTQPGQSGMSFVATISPFSTQAYRISFEQRAAKRQLEYTLKTTAGWGQPLDRATISIRTSAEVRVTWTSMKPDSINSAEEGRIYVMEREHFMPDENLTMRWERIRP